jgi:hypothetical protein
MLPMPETRSLASGNPWYLTLTTFCYRTTGAHNGITAFATAAAAGRNSLTGYFDGS